MPVWKCFGNQLDTRALLAGQMKEIVVFADDDHSMLGCAAPDLAIRRLGQIQIEHMLAFGALRVQQSRQRQRELVVDENFHEAFKTG